METFNNVILKLKEFGVKKEIGKKKSIYKITSGLETCYYITSGTVKIYIDHENGKRSIIDFIGKNQWLGELSIFCDEENIKENKVVEDIECYEFKIEEIRKLCLENPEISFYFAAYIGDKLLKRSYRMSESLNYPLDRKLAKFILEFENNSIYNLPHTDTSEYLNVSYRHILHVIKKFCDKEILIKEKNKCYRIINRQELIKISEG